MFAEAGLFFAEDKTTLFASSLRGAEAAKTVLGPMYGQIVSNCVKLGADVRAKRARAATGQQRSRQGAVKAKLVRASRLFKKTKVVRKLLVAALVPLLCTVLMSRGTHPRSWTNLTVALHVA